MAATIRQRSGNGCTWYMDRMERQKRLGGPPRRLHRVRDMTRDEITRATERACMASDYQDCER